MAEAQCYALSLYHKTLEELIGMEVVDNIRREKPRKGWLKGIDSKKGVGLVAWEDGEEELMRLNPPEEENEKEIAFLCPICGEECEKVYGEEIKWRCPSHGYLPWEGQFPNPEYPPEDELSLYQSELFTSKPSLFPTLFEIGKISEE